MTEVSRWGHGSPAREAGLGLAQGLVAGLLIELSIVAAIFTIGYLVSLVIS